LVGYILCTEKEFMLTKLIILSILFIGCSPVKYPDSKIECIKSCVNTSTAGMSIEPGICLGIESTDRECMHLICKEDDKKWELCDRICSVPERK
jgi:hypothetical protein